MRRARQKRGLKSRTARDFLNYAWCLTYFLISTLQPDKRYIKKQSFPDCTKRTPVSYICINLKTVQTYVISSVQGAQAKWVACVSTSDNFQHQLASCSTNMSCTVVESAPQNSNKFYEIQTGTEKKKLSKAKRQHNWQSHTGWKLDIQQILKNIQWRKKSFPKTIKILKK